MKCIKKILCAFCVLAFAISASGCYDGKDIENVSVILAMGADVEDGKNVFSFAIADINSKDNSSEAPVIIKKCEGANAYDALYNLQKTQSKQLTLTHIECAIFSQNAQNIYKDTLYDMAGRLGVSNTSYIVACDGNAGNLLEAISNTHETDFSVFIKDLLKNRKLMPKATLFDALNATKTNNDICIPMFAKLDDEIEYSMCIVDKNSNFLKIGFNDYNALNIYSVLKGYTNTLVIKNTDGAYGILLKEKPKIKVKNNRVEIEYIFENTEDLKYKNDAVKITNSFVNELIKNDTDILNMQNLSKVGKFKNENMISLKNMIVVTGVRV